MARLRYNGLSNSLGASLSDSATSVTFASKLTHAGGDVPTITGSDYIPVSILDADGKCEEIVWLTAYTAEATSGTVSRGKEGTAAVAHDSGRVIVNAPTVNDLSPEPADIAGLVAWYDAAAITGLSTGDPVDTWADRTGTYDLAQTSTARPTYTTNLQNGLPGVVFNGTAHYMDTASAPSLAGPDCTILMAWQTTANGTGKGIVGFVPASGNDWNNVDGFTFASGASNQNDLQLVRSTGANGLSVACSSDSAIPKVTLVAFRAGTAAIRSHRATGYDTYSDTTTIAAAKIRLGARQDSGLTGYKAMNVYELLIYNRGLPGGEWQQMANYLTDKWGIPHTPV
jgi:hypothetical protein